MTNQINIDYNTKFLVALDYPEIEALPCITHVGNLPTEIPRKAWIIFKGLAQFLGRTYLRFHYEGEDYLLTFDALNYLDEVPSHKPGQKVRYKNNNKPKKRTRKKLISGSSRVIRKKYSKKRRKI